MTINETTHTETMNAISEADTAAEAAADSVLDNMLGGDDTGGEAAYNEIPEGVVISPHRGKDGRFTKKEVTEVDKGDPVPKDTDGATVTTDTSSAAEPSNEDTGESELNPDEYKKALQAFQRAGTPPEWLQGQSEADIIERGQALAKQQAEQDSIGNRLKRLEEGKGPEAGSDSEPESGGVEVTDDPHYQRMVEEYGEEYAADMRGMVDSRTKQLVDQIAELQKQVNSTMQEATTNARSTVMDGLSERYNLEDEGRRAKVSDFMDSDKNEYGSTREAAEAACRQVFADELFAEYENRTKRTNEARTRGQSMTAHKKSTNDRVPVSDADREDMLLDAIMDGDQRAINKHRQRQGSMGFNEMVSD